MFGQTKKQKQKKKQTENKDNFFVNGTLDLNDIIMPDGIGEGRDYLYLGPKKFARVYAILGYPHSMNIGTLNEFFQIGGVDLSTYIENIPDDSVIKRLTNKFAVLMSNVALQLKRGYTINYAMKHAAEDLDSLREAIQINTEKMFYAQPIVYLWADNLKQLDDKAEIFDNICSKKSIVARCLVYDQLKGFLSGLPILNMKYTEGYRNMTTGAIACMTPTGNTEMSDESGIYYGNNVFTRSPVTYNPFNSRVLPNPHMFVCGTSGAGKSVFLKLKAARSAASGNWVVILDPQEEYCKLIENEGGQYISLQPGVKSGINPFELEIEEDESGKRTVDIFGKRSEIVEMISMFSEKFRGRPLQGIEYTAVDSAVEKLYIDRGITSDPESLYEEREEEDGKFNTGKVKKILPILSDLRNELIAYNDKQESSEIAELIEIMKMITGDGAMAIFDCQTTINLDKRIIAFSFKNLTDDFSKFFATVNSLSWIWSKFSNWKYKGYQKEVYVDEGSLFAKFQRSMDFLDNIARLGRKFHISLTLATQFVDDFLGSKSGEAIINLCATKVLLKQEAVVADSVAKFFHLSSKCSKLMTICPQGQAILLNSVNLVVMQVKPFEYDWRYIRT